MKSRVFIAVMYVFLWSLNSYAVKPKSCHQILSLDSSKSTGKLSSKELGVHTFQALKKVPEFQFIKEQADKLGLKVWLFGGTASSFLHYVKWDLLRQKGMTNLQTDRFDYDFTNIFRSTQDLDIVVDADPETARTFEGILKGKFPHFLGDKANKWEVRTLNHAMGTPGVMGFKEALLNDKDFNNQNTDTNSIGMVEVTDSDQARIKDLKSWDKEQSLFLEDVVKSQISYFRSDKHFETARAKIGENPEILSVLRLLVKAFQYELSFSDKVFKIIEEISNSFDPSKIENKVALRKIDETSKKLVMHAVNIEYAMNTLEKLGLRKKLISMGDKDQEGNFAWWLNREPLRSQKIGGEKPSSGKTAKELGIEIVAHETSSFLAYESITRAHSGEPNVLISRDQALGEAAAFGDGFYTRIGTVGARGTGLTVRFRVHLDAKEGVDFFKTGDYIVFLNKKALEVIPESLNFGIEDLMELAESGAEFQVDKSDLALLEKLKRKLNASVIIAELEGLLNSDNDEDLESLIKILRAVQDSHLSKLVSEDIVKEIAAEVYSKFKHLAESTHENDVLKYIKTIGPISEILKKHYFLYKKDFPNFLKKTVKSDMSFKVRKAAALEFILHEEVHVGTDLSSFFNHEELQEMRKEIGTNWIFAFDKRRVEFIKTLNIDLIDRIKMGDVQFLLYLVNRWFLDVNFKTISGFSILQQAAHFEKHRIINWLISRDELDLLALNSFGQNELEQLRASGRKEVAEKIESLRPDILTQTLVTKEKRSLRKWLSGVINWKKPVISFVEFKPGSFLMGANRVLMTLTEPFEVMSIDMTRGTYEKMVKLMREKLPDENSDYRNLRAFTSSMRGRSNYPLTNISYEEVVLWIRGLNELVALGDSEVDQVLRELFPGHDENKYYDLPTEAQWEYFARLGGLAMGFYPHGDNHDVVNRYVVANSEIRAVGSKLPVFYNNQPLYDVLGNVQNFAKDWFKRDLKGGVNSTGPKSGEERVSRGVAWFNDMLSNMYLSHREGRWPREEREDSGFRLFRMNKEVPTPEDL